MRQEVYVKFASAIRKGRAVKAASARRTVVQVKFAAALALRHVSRPATKEAQAAPDLSNFQTMMRRYMTPANTAGAIAGLGGGALLAKSLGLTPGKILGAGLGAGLLYGGYRLFTNPQLRQLVNDYGQKAIGYLGRTIRNGKLP